jgi:uncharacterized protein (TIGR02996 family)
MADLSHQGQHREEAAKEASMINTLQIILAIILDEPGEDLHRLAYADCCAEHGDRDRAEFIRLQLELQGAGAGALFPLRAGKSKWRSAGIAIVEPGGDSSSAGPMNS